MGKWSDLAREMVDCANSAISANSPPIGTNGPNGTGTLPAAIVMGVRRLKAMKCPRSLPSHLWPTFVADVVWLVDYGIASDALDQGWTPLDLFGVSADEEWQSLAAWIGGRRNEYGRACLLLTEIRDGRALPYAVHAREGRHCWHYLTPAPADAVLPWTM